MPRKKTKKIKELEALLIKIKQRTPEWFKAKLGRFSASGAGVVVPGSRGAYSSKREDSKNKIVDQIIDPEKCLAEILKEELKRKPDSIQWGIDNEPKAFQAYEIASGNLVDEVGIFLDPTNERICASPDGVLFSGDAIIEIKCPYSAGYHKEFINMKAAGIPVDDPAFLEKVKTLGTAGKSGYYNQMQLQMNCTETDRCDFVTFDPRLHEDEQLMIIPIQRNQEDIDIILAGAEKLLEESDDQVENRRKLRNE